MIGLAPVDTWPDLRLTLHVWPWCWKLRPRFYVDDVDGWRGHASFSWWCFAIEWWGNKPMFTQKPALTHPTEQPQTTPMSDDTLGAE